MPEWLCKCTICCRNICSENYNWVITLSTQSLQAMAGTNKTIPMSLDSDWSLPSRCCKITKRTPAEYNRSRHISACWDCNPNNAWNFSVSQDHWYSLESRRSLLGSLYGKSKNSTKKYGFQLEEATVASTADVDQAIESLLDKKPDILYIRG